MSLEPLPFQLAERIGMLAGRPATWTMLFVGALVAAVTLTRGVDDSSALVVYRVFGGAPGRDVLTALTGARTPVGWFKACPLLLAVVIALLLVGSLL